MGQNSNPPGLTLQGVTIGTFETRVRYRTPSVVGAAPTVLTLDPDPPHPPPELLLWGGVRYVRQADGRYVLVG